MTPKGKSKEIVESYQSIQMLKDFGGMDLEIAKECAKIHVRGIIELVSCNFPRNQRLKVQYWNEVLEEIHNL